MILNGLTINKKCEYSYEQMKRLSKYDLRRPTVKVRGYGHTMYIGKFIGMRQVEDDIFMIVDTRERWDDKIKFLNLNGYGDRHDAHRVKCRYGTLTMKRTISPKTGRAFYDFIINIGKKG